MEDEPFDDQADAYRAFSCELAQWILEGSDTHPASIQEFIAGAALIEHYITNGMSLEVTETGRKFVRGGV